MPFRNPDAPHDGPPWTWRQIGEAIALGGPDFHIWREAPWLRAAISDNPQQSPRIQAYELTEKPYAKLLDSAVELWLRGKPLPELDKTATFLLGLRFAVVGNLLMSFEDVGALMPPAPEDEIGSVHLDTTPIIGVFGSS